MNDCPVIDTCCKTIPSAKTKNISAMTMIWEGKSFEKISYVIKSLGFFIVTLIDIM
jgi:hypothetical protein